MFKIFRKRNEERSEDTKETGAIDTENDVIEGELIDKDDIIIPTSEVKYTGQIVSVHDGYSFIGRVKRGYETINTNGDVFTPHEFTVGAMVEFTELITDPKRPGKFRVESASVIEGVLVESGKKSRVLALQSLSQRSIYHIGAKEIDPEKVKKAAENMPFAEMLSIHKGIIEETGQARDISEMAKEFLQATFANLNSIGVSYSIAGDVNEEEEKNKVDDAIKTYRDNNMEGQVVSVEEEYTHFSGIRKAFIMMHQSGILSVETVIPIRYLPDLLVTAPVWFVHSKNNDLSDLTDEVDPHPDHAIKFFCDQVGTKEFAWLYQIYNRRTRPFKSFKGRDIVPLPLMDIMEQAKQVFDYTVIATPYHDIASREWVDPAWLRSIDPFLFGFMKGLPYMFLFGRWSGTGLFPLMCDMIADTMDHLRVNKEKLHNFPLDAYWYKGGVRGDNNCLRVILNGFAEEVIKAYEENRLFEFLRSENAETGAAAAK